jgi:L-lactate utilization protein LutB
MDLDEADNDTYEAFNAGAQYALRRVNEVLEAAGVDLEIVESDLGNNYGYILTVVGDEPEDFIKRVMKKPRKVVESWV